MTDRTDRRPFAKAGYQPFFRSLPHCVLAFLIMGCSTTRTVHRPLTPPDRAEMENLAPGHWEVTYVPNLPAGAAPVALDAAELRLRGDAVEFIPARSPRAEVQQVPIAALRTIVDVSSRRGSIDGAGLGLLAGTIAGAVVGFSLGSDARRPGCVDNDCIALPASFKAGIGAIVGGLLGLGVGFVSGSIIGHRDITEFDN